MDAPFGSCGSAFALRPDDGAYLANPPFDPALIGALSSERSAPARSTRGLPLVQGRGIARIAPQRAQIRKKLAGRKWPELKE